MNAVIIGKGKLAGKGVYANRDFNKGELVLSWDTRELTKEEFDELPKDEHKFVHSFWGKMCIFPEPSRYTNHSATPNTKADFEKMCDYALKPIRKGEMITTDSAQEVKHELETFIMSHEESKISNFTPLKGGYRNAVVSYSLPSGKKKTLSMKRADGNWRVI